MDDELYQKGISDCAVAGASEQLRESELDAARAVWARKFGTLPHDTRERARQVRFMQSRGFALETVLLIIRHGVED